MAAHCEILRRTQQAEQVKRNASRAKAHSVTRNIAAEKAGKAAHRRWIIPTPVFGLPAP
jgi:hypothetical protein